MEPPFLTTSQSGDAMDLSASLSGLKCFKCGHFGHIATFCPKKTGLSVNTAAQATKAQFMTKKKGKRRKPQVNLVTIEQGAGSSIVNNTQPCFYLLTDSNLKNPLVFLLI